jgi:hypothetical protein
MSRLCTNLDGKRESAGLLSDRVSQLRLYLNQLYSSLKKKQFYGIRFAVQEPSDLLLLQCIMELGSEWMLQTLTGNTGQYTSLSTYNNIFKMKKHRKNSFKINWALSAAILILKLLTTLMKT